jgi:Zinc finger, C2H2 type
MSISNKKDDFKCNICDITFSTKYTLNRHLIKNICGDGILDLEYNPNIIEHINNKIKCEHCNKLFEKKSRLNRHLSTTTGYCYKKRNPSSIINTISNRKEYNNCVFNTINNNQTYINNINNIQQNINIQPVIEKVVLAKHGEETISHITKDIMLEILDIESFPEMCTELMRLLYFNKEVPENRNWTIVYPKNQNAGVEYNHKTLRFERKKTYNIIDDKFSNMVNLLFDLVQEISRDDIENNNLSKRQKINVNKYCMHYGQLDISKTSKVVYDSIHSLAYNSRKDQMKEWGESGHKGNHLSLKF